MKKIFIITICFFALKNSLIAQPVANPGGFGRNDFLGAIGAALIIGGLIYLLVTWIGEKISDATNKYIWKKVFKILGIIIWIALFIVFLNL